VEILLLENLAADARQWLAARHQVDYRPELALDAARCAPTCTRPRRWWCRPGCAWALRCWTSRRAWWRWGASTRAATTSTSRPASAAAFASSRPSAPPRATAEFLLTGLLTLFRSGGNLSVGGSAGVPQSPGREINDSVIGLFGMSAPAQMLAPMLVALGARVLGYDPALHRSAELWTRLGVQPLSLAEMLQAADAVSMQTVYASRYRGLVGERVLQSCKPGQLWVSASRAALFDLDALAQALRTGRMAACWLDSDDEVRRSPASRCRLPTVRITPRLAPRTHESYLRGSWYLADRLHQTLEFSAQHGGWRGPESAPMALG
jgi:phosphoglycerate dehydrogenase-like enzyme